MLCPFYELIVILPLTAHNLVAHPAGSGPSSVWDFGLNRSCGRNERVITIAMTYCGDL